MLAISIFEIWLWVEGRLGSRVFNKIANEGNDYLIDFDDDAF